MRITEFINEAANPAQQAAIAINMKKHHQKPKSEGVAEASQQTLQSYRKKAAKQKSDALDVADRPDTDDATWVKNMNIASKRKDGIAAANKRLGVAEGSSTMWEVSFDYGPHQSDSVKVKAGSEEEAIAKVEKAAEKRGRDIMINWAKPAEQGVAEGGYPEVDHMHGTRGINLPSAPTKKFFTDKKQWTQAVDDINSSKYDDNSDYTGVTGRTTVSINDREWARWSDAQQKGYIELSSMTEGETWSKHNNPKAGGMSKKSVKSYRRSHPGSKIQTAVTTKPSKIKKGSKDASRRKSFCARMKGMKKHRTGAKTARDPNSNINKSLRRWNCESIEQLQELVMLAEQFIRNNKK